MDKPKLTVQEVNDPAEDAKAQAQAERARLNIQWLESHWDELWPKARGRFIAIAGQEAFIAGTDEEAWQQAKSAHPQDDGAISQYVFPTKAYRC